MEQIFFNTYEFWHIKVLHLYKVQTETDLLIIIQELIHVGYQQSK